MRCIVLWILDQVCNAVRHCRIGENLSVYPVHNVKSPPVKLGNIVHVRTSMSAHAM